MSQHSKYTSKTRKCPECGYSMFRTMIRYKKEITKMYLDYKIIVEWYFCSSCGARIRLERVR